MPRREASGRGRRLRGFLEIRIGRDEVDVGWGSRSTPRLNSAQKVDISFYFIKDGTLSCFINYP
ncbi:hypothetical protein N7492_006764 [Penicillium capsulatum]|uniref:Uncharacterized protein n=1 Tax=Penicillium capsulatum TaxID=69766 RepID=A0A9W9LK48_9EURO|nr:hypothetical protein N7492_006764 [Penicillium capsulatum]KAJ6116600.1 hypothetical protein N7512_006325 [Penicillium capsulatum]